MAISLSQKVDDDFKGIWRWILGFAITDEIFAVAIQNPGKIKRNYFMGLTIIPIIGWTLGTLGGALLGNILPAIITNALGVALYGMFIAVVVPKARDDSHVFVAVCIAVAISVALKYIPVFAYLSGGFEIFLPYLLVMAIVTYLIRAIPLVLVKHKIKNKFFNSFLYYIPYTVLAAMTIPAIFTATGNLISAIAGLAVAIVLAYQRKSLIVVAVGACAAVFIIEGIITLI